MPHDPAPWRLTDIALADLSQHLLAREPERGAALLGPRGQRLVTQVLADPDPGSPTSYGHSDTLRDLLAQTLILRRDLGYRGTVHSHPGVIAEPSDQDEAAFRAVLDANPHLGEEVLFPIAVAAPVSDLDEVAARWGDAHLLSVADGTIGGYICHRSDTCVELLSVQLDVLPVGSLVRALCAGTGRRPLDAGVVRDPTGGTSWLRFVLTADQPTVDFSGCPNAVHDREVLVSSCFPACPPMFSGGAAAFRPLPWDPSTPQAESVAVAREVLWS